MSVKYGRLVYAFNPVFFEDIAIPSGPRPVLLSYILLKEKFKGRELTELEKWRRYSQPYTLIIDSGVYTLRSRLKLGINAISRGVKDFTKEDFDFVFNRSLKGKSKIDQHVKDYGQFLKDADGLYDGAIEMDMDDWMGVEYSDIYYQELCGKVSSHNIMRVWHQSGRDFDDWLNWIKDPNQSYICIEGGTILGRNIDLYNKFIFSAHENKKKVHILALTTPQIFRDTPVNTTDSSSFIQQAQYATVRIPELGSVYFGHLRDLSKIKASDNCYNVLNEDEAEFCRQYLKSIGFTVEDALATGIQGFNNRTIMNLYYYDEYVDQPYISKSIHEALF